MIVFVCASTMAQENPSEVKEEVQIKTVKHKDGEKVTENKVKVITRETSDVKLDKKDAKKINQSRVGTTTKIEKKVMVAKNTEDYKTLSQVTYYVVGNKKFMFTPNENGFNLANSNEDNEFITIANAWFTIVNGSYIIKGETQNGVGHFDENGNFIVEYYDENSKSVMSTIYNKDNVDKK